MKLAMEHYVLRNRFGDEEAVRMIARAGFDAMDFSFYWAPRETNILDFDNRIEYTQKLRAVADESGLAISQAHAPFDLNLNDPPEKQARDYEQILRSIELAGLLGVRQIVVHNLVTEKDSDFERVNLAFFKSLEGAAAKANVRIAVENLWKMDGDHIVGGRLSTPDALSAFLDQLDPARFCGCIDVGHAAIVGEDPARFIRCLGAKRLQALHIQDTDLTRDLHLLPYLGKHNWPEITRALGEIGYQGELTFEIFRFLTGFPNEALADAICFAHRIGRLLIAEIEQAAR